MEKQEFIDSLDAFRSHTDPQPFTDDKPFVQVYKGGKNAGKRVKGIVISVILYPDNEHHVQVLISLFEKGYNFACALHDKDYFEKDENESVLSNDDSLSDDDLREDIPQSNTDSKLKKAHVHVVFSVKNPRTNTGFAKEIKVESRLVRIVNGLSSQLAYLCHRDNKTKYPYNPDIVCGPLSVRLPTDLKSVDGYYPQMVIEVVEWIESKEYITWKEVIKYCNKYGYNDILYNSKSSYYQSVRQAFYDKQRASKQFQFDDFQELTVNTLRQLKLENQVLLTQMRTICEMFDLPMILDNKSITQLSNFIQLNDFKNSKKERKTKK